MKRFLFFIICLLSIYLNQIIIPQNNIRSDYSDTNLGQPTSENELEVISILPLYIYIQKETKFLKENQNARGGSTLLESMETQLIRGVSTIRGEQVVPFVIYLKRPDLVRVETIFNNDTLVTASDGNTSWYINPFDSSSNAIEFIEQETKKLGRIEALYWGYLNHSVRKGINVKYFYKENIEGIDYYIFKIKENGEVKNLYLDADTYLETRLVEKIKPYNIKLETVFSDFRKVDGFVTAHKIELIVNDNKEIITNIDSISINPLLDDSIFRKPIYLENLSK